MKIFEHVDKNIPFTAVVVSFILEIL